MHLPSIFKLNSCVAVPIVFVALIINTPAWTEGLAFGIIKLYLLLLTSFSICTPSLLVNSLPLIILNWISYINLKIKINFYQFSTKINYQLIVGLGLASTMHSSLTDSSLLIGASGSGTLTKTGPPKIKMLKNFKPKY